MSVSELLSSGRAAANSLLERKRGGLDGRGGAGAAPSALSPPGRAPAMPWPGALDGRSRGAGVGGCGMRWPLVKGCGCRAGASVAGPGPVGNCREAGVMAGALDWPEPAASAYGAPWCDMARAARRWEGAEDRDAEDGDGAGDVEGGILAAAAAAAGWGWGFVGGGGWGWRSERAVMVKVSSRSKNRHGSSFSSRLSLSFSAAARPGNGTRGGRLVGFDMQRRRRDRMTMTGSRWKSDAAAGGTQDKMRWSWSCCWGRVATGPGAWSDLGWPRKAAGVQPHLVHVTWRGPTPLLCDPGRQKHHIDAAPEHRTWEELGPGL